MSKFPSVRTPNVDEILEIADDFGLRLTVEDARSFQGLMGGSIASYDRLDELPEPKLPVKYPRMPGYRPARRRTRSMPGTGRPRSRARAVGAWPESGWS